MLARANCTVRLFDATRPSDSEFALYLGLLNAAEFDRYQRFVRSDRQRQFVVGRALLRHSLGNLLGMSPTAVRLVERAGNAPMLDLPGCADIGFSLSHSGRWVACAVSATSRLGLDVELIDASRNIDELAVQAFDPEQQAWLARRPPAGRLQDFYQLWSATEARFKLGEAVAQEVHLSHPELSIVLCSARPLAADPELTLAVL
jgi:4'-phosphopantetheinyl transferase